MENTAYKEFLTTWHHIMDYGVIGMIASAIVFFIFHHIKISSIKDYKGKYDYINLYEIRNFKLVFIFLGVAAAMYSNAYNDHTASKSIVWFFVRFFVAGCIGTLIGYVASLVLEYYYPGKMQKKLDKWRYLPRINPKTGNKMKLLSEAEEDVHLDEGMQAEEDVFSVDYDVWIDEVTGDTIIEKYEGAMEALECGSCGFTTLKVAREEIIEPATATTDGELLKHFECRYCESKRTTQHKIAKLSNASAEADMVKKQTNIKQAGTEAQSIVDSVKIHIHETSGKSEVYEFYSLSQARKFMQEFKNNKENN